MKSRENARERRVAEIRRRKEQWSPKKEPDDHVRDQKFSAVTGERRKKEDPQKTPEEEAKEFLDYLDKYDKLIPKEEEPVYPKRNRHVPEAVGRLNLETGMPVVSEALDRLNLGLQEMRCRGFRMVKIIHGYGSTGRGGKIGSAVRKELAEMKKRKQITDFIAGENFGPVDPASRRLVERSRSISRDPDYGRMNHGITIVAL